MSMIVHERGTGRFSLFTRSLAAALVALLAVPLQALAATSSSGGGGPQKVVVIGFGNEEGVAKHAARLEWEAAQMAATMGRYELLDLAALLDPEGEKAREEAGVQAKKNWAAAKGAYDELEVQLAVDLCDRAMGLYEKSDITRTLPEMVRAWTLKIASLIANADVPTANIEQNLLLPLDVDPNFDPNLFDPDFINNAKKKKADLQAKATLSIDVASKPVPARVFVDGKFRGVTPTEVKNLAPGDHFITLRAPGYKLIQKRTRAGAASSVGEALEATPHLAKFESVLSRVKQSFGTDSRAAPSRELAQLLGADQLVFVSVSRESQQVVHVAVARVRGSDGAEIAFQEENLADDEARYGSLSQGLFHRLLTEDVRNKSLARAIGATTTATGGAQTPVLRYTGYGLIGGAVAALAVGVTMGMLARSDASDYAGLRLAQTNPQYAALESSGRSRAFIADLSFLGAVLLGASGGVLVALDNRGSGAPDKAPAPDNKPQETRAPEARPAEPAAAREPAPVREAPPEEKRPAPAAKPEEKKAPPPLKAEEKKPQPKVEEKKPEPVPAKAEEKKPEPAPVKAEEKKPDPAPANYEEKPAPPAPKPEQKKPEPKKAVPGSEGKFKDDYLDDFRDD